MELSIEEKAKRYDEAIKRASNLHKDAVEMENNMTTKTCEIIFPELKESEDERIWKALVELISTYLRGHENGKIHGVYAKDILAWLEKQGEQKPADKVEPKFNVGDWVVHDMSDGRVSPPTQIVDMTNKSYVFDTKECFYFSDAEEVFRKWTIQDANDGDVLASTDGLSILIFRNLETNETFSSYYNIEGKGELHWSNECFIPATKEQRDKLEKAMADAEYTFDFDKKELKKIKQKPHEDIVDEINRKAFPNHYGGCAPVLEIKQTKICKMVGPDDPEHLADFKDLLPNIFIGMEMCIEGTMYRIKDIRTIICGDLCRQIIEVE